MFEVVQTDGGLYQSLEEIPIWFTVSLPDFLKTIMSLKELPFIELPDTPEKSSSIRNEYSK